MVVDFSFLLTFLFSAQTDQCALIDPNARVDCGWPGMKPSECIKMGCCFDSSVDNSYYCFYKPSEYKVVLESGYY